MLTPILRLASALFLFLLASFSPAAEPDPLRAGIARLAARPVLDRAETDRRLAEEILKRIPPLEFPLGSEDWEARGRDLRERLLEEVIFAGVPRAIVEGSPRVEEGPAIETRKGYRIRKLRYEAYPGLWIPALLYEPDAPAGGGGKPPIPAAGGGAPNPPPQAAERLACVLNPNGHVGPLGKARPEEQIRCINLAKRGILALKPEWFAFGELSGPGFEHNSIAYLDLCGTSGVSLFYLALKRGLDVLLAQTLADPRRVAVTGLSGGGWQTIVISALDDRVKAMIPNAGYSGLALRVEHQGSIGDLEQNPTDLVAIADYPILTAAFAPRPALLIYNERDDCCFPAAKARASVWDPVAPLYARFYPGVEFGFHENSDPGTHNYDIDNRRALYRFLNRQGYPRGPAPDDEIPCGEEVLDYKDLVVGLPPGNLDFQRIALDLARGLPRRSWPRTGPGTEGIPPGPFLSWREESIGRLRKILRFSPSRVERARDAWEEGSPDVKARGRILELEGGSAVGVVDLAPARSAPPPSRAAVAFADGLRADLVPEAADLLSLGYRVFLLDLAPSGENRPERMAPWHWSMMIAAAGGRPLGLQASQALAAAAWARAETGADKVLLVGSGSTASLAALAAGAFDPAVSTVITVGLLPSLKTLIEDGADYHRSPALYTFGLLEAFDVKELIALAAPRRVFVLRPAGAPARLDEELRGLGEVLRALGGFSLERNLSSLASTPIK